MIRVLSCLLLFGLGAQALGGGAFGVIVSGAIALGANYLWKKQDRDERTRRHREQIVADEQLRLDVLHRREQEGRLP
jgi:hypothetical protein